MIKAMILDVDGVLVGEREGYNFPDPNPAVLSKLHELRERGIHIILCTGKPYFSIETIIEKAHLDDPHITNGGALIIDPIDHKVVSKHPIPRAGAKAMVEIALEHDFYIEAYTPDTYYIQESQRGEMTEKHGRVLQCLPEVVPSLMDIVNKKELLRVMFLAKDETEREEIKELFKPFSASLHQTWAVHPNILPIQFGLVTEKGISKKKGAEEVMEDLRINFEDVLGAGDSESDWSFMQLCRYKVAMGNASDDLKELVKKSDEKDSFIAPDVNEEGILTAFEHFSL